MTVNFSLLALDQILNTAATLRHMSGGQFGVPLVIRMATGAGKQLAAQHSHSLEGWFAHIPGIKILAPATVADARAMLAPALADLDPVLIFENVMLYNRRAVIVDDGWRSGSLTAEISARVTETSFWSLDAPVERVCGTEVPMPYPRHLEQAALPQPADIVSAAKRALQRL